MDLEFLKEDKYTLCPCKGETVKKWYEVNDSPDIAGIPLTNLPNRYNLRGKRIMFTKTDLLLPVGFPDFVFLMENGGVNILPDAGRIVYYNAVEDSSRIIYDGVGWTDKSDIVLPNILDLIVSTNTLFPHTGNTWGFDYAYIVE